MSVNTNTHYVQNEDDTWYYYIEWSNGGIDYDSRKDMPPLEFKTLRDAEEDRRWGHANGFDAQAHYNHSSGSFMKNGMYAFFYEKKAQRIEGTSTISGDTNWRIVSDEVFGGPCEDGEGNHKPNKYYLNDCDSIEHAKVMMEKIGLTDISISEVKK